MERGASPLGLGAKGGPPPPYGRRPLPLVGISPTWEGEGGSTSPLAYIKWRRAPLLHTIQSHLFEISLSLSLSLLLLPSRVPIVLEPILVGGFSTIRTPLRCWNRDPNSPSSATRLVRSPGEHRLHRTRVIPRGAARAVLLHRREVFIGKSSTRPGGRKDRTTTPATIVRSFPAFRSSTRYELRIPSVTYISIAQVLGIGCRR